MLSDHPNMKYKPTGRRRSVANRQGRWSDSQKIEAVTTYMILGSLKLVAGALKIPFETLKTWKASEWWKTIELDLKTQDDLQLSNRLRRIVDKSYDVVEDRLANGDFVYDQKSGEMRRKPVALRDAHKVAMDVAERRDDLINRHVAGDSIATDKIEKTLEKLATEFARIASKVGNNPVNVTDVIFAEEKPDAKNE